MTPLATTCASCGSKIASSRERCPRCRAVVRRDDPAAGEARSRLMKGVAAGIVCAFALSVGLLWMTQAAGEDGTNAPPDPLAARRHAMEAAASEQEPAEGAAEAAFDPAPAGTAAYRAGNYDDALRHFQEAVARNPQDAEALSNLGQMLVRLGRVEEALPSFEQACALNPDRWAYRFNLARALAVLERWDDSIAAYRHAQQLFPSDYATAFNLALTLHKKGDDAAAVEEYQRAIALDPSDASFHMALGISYERLQKSGEAAAAYREYLRLAPEAGDAERVRERIARLTGQGESS